MALMPAAAAPAEQATPDSELQRALASHPHARAVLGGAVSTGSPSHAYLFHGAAGTGKARAARAFAAELLADGAAEPHTVTERVARESHPDLTWVRPSGAAEMLVSDIDEPVVAAATRTPFESKRRVFVIEAAETMNDQAANRLLKTLEEPASFVHLLLLTDRREDVLPTIRSRCQLVRFDPLPADEIASTLTGLDAEQAKACARLALGDASLAAWLGSDDGPAFRTRAERFVRASLAGETAERPWEPLLAAAKGAAATAGEAVSEQRQREAELLPSKERKRHEREGLEARRRAERRARTRALDLGLRLAELWIRDLVCLRHEAPELIHAVDRMTELEQDRERFANALPLERALELIGATRLSLAANVSEELALEALAYRLQALSTD
jgi:DNA polymerase-3 subunit delta'